MGSDAAEAVLCKHPTPRSLFEAYRAVRKVADERNVNPVICATKASPCPLGVLGFSTGSTFCRVPPSDQAAAMSQ